MWTRGPASGWIVSMLQGRRSGGARSVASYARAPKQREVSMDLVSEYCTLVMFLCCCGLYMDD